MNDYEVYGTDARIQVFGPHDTDDFWQHLEDNEDPDGRHALTLGNPDSMAFAVLGTVAGIRAFLERAAAALPDEGHWVPAYETWRHGGWYVTNIRYPSGACGCVSRNYPDRKWRIVCDPRPFETAPTFANRDEAARAERLLALRAQVEAGGGVVR